MGHLMQDVTKSDLNRDEWAKMSVAERVARCHEHAREAIQLANAARPDLKQTYRDIAAKWNVLAAEMENAAPRPERT